MAVRKGKRSAEADRLDFIGALDEIEKERQIPKAVMLKAIEDSLKLACKSQFAKGVNPRVTVNPENGEVKAFLDYEVVDDEDVINDNTQIRLTKARLEFDKKAEVGDIVSKEVTPKNFGRIAAQKAKQTVVQTIRQEERKVLYNYYKEKKDDIITGVVQRYTEKNIGINLGRLDTVLNENEQVKTERFKPTERIKLYVVDVMETHKDPRVTVSRTHPNLVKRLFEEEVTELQDGTVQIINIAREAGSRTKMSVFAESDNIDPVGACVGVNGARVNSVVKELRGEKIDIIVWNEDPEVYIENALSPATVKEVYVDVEEKTAEVTVPDNQLSLAIGKEGQNARLAAKLTGYKIDIKCESDVANATDDEE
ncbi:MAG: transcription termination factor NusA [Lachnospiraceae bacterium]|nr:transcription termination factor NusA [Lachnospiraceae bacterium]